MNTMPARLGDVIELRYGKSLPERNRTPGSTPVFGSSGMVGTHTHALVHGPGIIVGRAGSIGEVHWTDEDFFPIDSAFFVKPKKDGVDLRFLFYLLRGLPLKEMNTGAAVPGLNRDNAYRLQVTIPEQNVQLRIVGIVSAYDDLIENNRRRIALLEDAARQLYKEWFVRFRFPGHEHIPIVDGVPKGWEVRQLCEVAENFDRKRIPLSVMEREARVGEFPYHGAAGVLDYVDGFIFDGRYLLMGEDGTVVTKSGAPMLQLVEGKFWVSNHAHVLQGTLVSTEFLFCHLLNYQIAGHITGVAQPKITQKSMNRIPIIYAPEFLRRSFQEFVEPLVSLRFLLQQQVRHLITVRDVLLPKLMNGEIAV